MFSARQRFLKRIRIYESNTTNSNTSYNSWTKPPPERRFAYGQILQHFRNSLISSIHICLLFLESKKRSTSWIISHNGIKITGWPGRRMVLRRSAVLSSEIILGGKWFGLLPCELVKCQSPFSLSHESVNQITGFTFPVLLLITASLLARISGNALANSPNRLELIVKDLDWVKSISSCITLHITASCRENRRGFPRPAILCFSPNRPFSTQTRNLCVSIPRKSRNSDGLSKPSSVCVTTQICNMSH